MDTFLPEHQNASQGQGQAQGQQHPSQGVQIMRTSGLDAKSFFLRLAKYIVEGLAVAVACFVIPKRNRPSWKEVAMIAVTAAFVFAILDLFAPSIGNATRQGAGFGMGLGVVGGVPIM